MNLIGKAKLFLHAALGRTTLQGEFLVWLIKSCGYKSYLELGLYHGETFQQVRKFVDIADGVDVEYKSFVAKGHFFHMTTDEFFDKHKDRRYDMIFIDAWHEFSQVKRDLDNALSILNSRDTRGGGLYSFTTQTRVKRNTWTRSSAGTPTKSTIT